MNYGFINIIIIIIIISDEDGNIRFLKVDFIPNYNVMIRKFVCKYGKLHTVKNAYTCISDY